jgi:hypothetical protein
MLRINLLPAYLAEQKKTRLAIILASLLFASVLFGMLGYHFLAQKPETTRLTEEADDAERRRDAAQAIQRQAQDTLAKVQPILDKVNFVEDVRFHNTIRQKIYENAARFTIREVEYDSMAVQGSSFSANAYCKSIADLGRFYLTMFGNPDFTAVSIQGIPGWPNAATLQQSPFGGGQGLGQSPFDGQQRQQVNSGAAWFPVQLAATVVKPVVTPALPASLLVPPGGAAAPGGFGGAGLPPGYGPSGGAGAPTDDEGDEDR